MKTVAIQPFTFSYVLDSLLSPLVINFIFRSVSKFKFMISCFSFKASPICMSFNIVVVTLPLRSITEYFSSFKTLYFSKLSNPFL